MSIAIRKVLVEIWELEYSLMHLSIPYNTHRKSQIYLFLLAYRIMEKKEQSSGEMSTDMSGLWQNNNETLQGPINASPPFNTTMIQNYHVEVEHNSSNGK